MALLAAKNVDNEREIIDLLCSPEGYLLTKPALGDARGRPYAVGVLWASDPIQAGYGATSGAIDANDALGDVMVFSVPKRGRILSMKLYDPDDDTLAATAHVYNKPFTSATASDAAFAMVAADRPNWVTTQVFPATMTDEGAFKVAEIPDIDSEYTCDGYLYVQLSSTGTPNIATANTMPFLQLFILPLG